MAVISRKEPHRIPDLIGYQSLIIQSSCHCQEGCWVIYDRRFHLKASAVVIPEWSHIDITVWKMAFPEHPPTGAPYLAKSLTLKPPQQPSNTQAASSNRICLAWNESPSLECLRPFCNFDIFALDASIPILLTKSVRPLQVETLQRPGQITSGILHGWSMITHKMLNN